MQKAAQVRQRHCLSCVRSYAHQACIALAFESEDSLQAGHASDDVA